MNSCRILCIGAGGLGCELLKDLALSGFRRIDVIDMDTIDVSNLNRQFLFRPKDIGRDKATVAAEFINARVPLCTVTPHHAKIQDFGADFYRGFNVVICGLDSVVARRWINGMLISLLSYNADGSLKEETIKPLIDGGTEGFKGSARVILPGKTACMECTLGLFPPQVKFPMCTLANTPRLPEHCIEYAKIVLWPKERPDVTLDGDDPEHIKWLCEHASERAKTYGIEGVTYRLTQGVVKNIIPNVASTSAIIAAACVNEVFKLASFCASSMNNYMVFNDTDGVYSFTYENDRNADCVCANRPVEVDANSCLSLTHLVDALMQLPNLQLTAPGFTTADAATGRNKTLYLRNPPAIERATRKNLDKTLKELGLRDGQVINVTDPVSPRNFEVQLRFV